MAINYTRLNTILQTDPYTLGVSLALSNEVNRDKLNVASQKIDAPVIISDLLQWLASTGIMDRLKKQSDLHISEQIRSICQTVLRMIDRPEILEIDVREAKKVTMLDALVTGGVVTAAEKTDLLDKVAKRSATVAEKEGWDVIYLTNNDVMWARG